MKKMSNFFHFIKILKNSPTDIVTNLSASESHESL